MRSGKYGVDDGCKLVHRRHPGDHYIIIDIERRRAAEKSVHGVFEIEVDLRRLGPRPSRTFCPRRHFY